MRGRLTARVLALASLMVGCELTAELGVYTTETSELAATESSVDLDTGDDTTAEPDTGDSGDGDLGDGDGDGDDVCEIDGSEAACRVCVEHLCCEQLMSCDVESGCNCMLDCLAESEPVACAMTCTPGAAYFQLLQCQITSCDAVCE